MNRLEKKALSIGLGGIAAALLMAGGEANAAPCLGEETVGTIQATPGFSCTLADKVFSGFSFSNVPAAALVEIGQNGSQFSITLNRDSVFFPTNSAVEMAYTIAIAPGNPGTTIVSDTLGVDVSIPIVVTSKLVTGNNSGGHLLGTVINSGTETAALSPGDTSDTVLITSELFPGSQLNSITDDFTQHTPEPMSLSLLGLGLAGIAFAARRRS